MILLLFSTLCFLTPGDDTDDIWQWKQLKSAVARCSDEFIYGFTQKKNKNNFSHLKINCEKKPERTLWERVGYTTQQLCLNHKAEEVFFPISWIFLCLPLHTGSLFLSLSVAGWVTVLCCWSQATGLHLQLSRLHGFKRAGRSHGRFWTASMSSHVIHKHKVNTAQWSILLQKTQRND